MNDLVFLVATYNEQEEITDLLASLEDFIDIYVISDDGSEDDTLPKVASWRDIRLDKTITVLMNEHIGLAETVKRLGIEHIVDVYGPDIWVLMLDADERISRKTISDIIGFTQSAKSEGISHVWFTLDEFIDGRGPLRTFLKCRLFRASAVQFSDSVHEDDRFTGNGANFGWNVLHRKSSSKQIMREREYLKTYQKLLEEGKVTQEWVDRCKSFHYFVKE